MTITDDPRSEMTETLNAALRMHQVQFNRANRLEQDLVTAEAKLATIRERAVAIGWHDIVAIIDDESK